MNEDAVATVKWHLYSCKKSIFPPPRDRAAKWNPDVPGAPERWEIFRAPAVRKHAPYFGSLPVRNDVARQKKFQKRSQFSSLPDRRGKLHGFPVSELSRQSGYLFLQKPPVRLSFQAARTTNPLNLLPIARIRDGQHARSAKHRVLSYKSRQEPTGEFYRSRSKRNKGARRSLSFFRQIGSFLFSSDECAVPAAVFR